MPAVHKGLCCNANISSLLLACVCIHVNAMTSILQDFAQNNKKPKDFSSGRIQRQIAQVGINAQYSSLQCEICAHCLHMQLTLRKGTGQR